MDRFKIITIIVLVLIGVNLLALNYTLFANNKTSQNTPTQSTPTPTQSDQTLTPTLTPIACDETCVKNIVKSATASITLATTRPVSQTTISKQTPTSAPTQSREFFIAIGSGQSAGYDWSDLPNAEKTINLHQFENIKSINFEATFSVPSSTGIGYVRLFNITDSQPVIGSDLSTTSGSATFLSSQALTLEGSKLYKLQTKQSERKEVVVTQSRIKITTN